MKILVLGDIHGRECWKAIIDKESPDKIIFLGDYVSSHDNITADQQISNLEKILSLKEDNPEKVILLRGNHDIQHLGYHWAECSGYFPLVAQHMIANSTRFLNNTQWIHIEEELGIIFSHSGISEVWMKNSGITDIHLINNLKPSELFAFTPDSMFDTYGQSVTQPPIWIRPQSLCKCNIVGWDQVIGHTPVKQIVDMHVATKNKQHILLCDTLGSNEYLVINDGTVEPKKFISNETIK